MGEFVRLLIEILQFLWPLRLVQEWEAGGYYVLGRWHHAVQKGPHIVLPGITEVKVISIAEAIVGTGRQDITLSDESMLSFAATATVRVTDPYRAINSVDAYGETIQELLASVLAEKLADVDARRLTAEKRTRLMSDLSRWVANEAAEYGCTVSKVRFTSFVTGVKTYRVLVDQNTVASW